MYDNQTVTQLNLSANRNFQSIKQIRKLFDTQSVKTVSAFEYFSLGMSLSLLLHTVSQSSRFVCLSVIYSNFLDNQSNALVSQSFSQVLFNFSCFLVSQKDGTFHLRPYISQSRVSVSYQDFMPASQSNLLVYKSNVSVNQTMKYVSQSFSIICQSVQIIIVDCSTQSKSTVSQSDCQFQASSIQKSLKIYQGKVLWCASPFLKYYCIHINFKKKSICANFIKFPIQMSVQQNDALCYVHCFF